MRDGKGRSQLCHSNAKLVPSVWLYWRKCWWWLSSSRVGQGLVTQQELLFWGCFPSCKVSWWVRPVQTELFAITLLTQTSLELRHKGHCGEDEMGSKGPCLGPPIAPRLSSLESHVALWQKLSNHSLGLWQRKGQQSKVTSWLSHQWRRSIHRKQVCH